MADEGKKKPPADVLCNDHPTKYAHLGWRFLCALLSWFLLGKSISVGNAFFASLALFVVPLMLDYYKYEPRDKIRKMLTFIAKGVNGIFLVCACLGMFGIVSVVDQKNILVIQTSPDFVFSNVNLVSVQFFWILLLLTVIVCAVDWAANRTTLETDIVKSKEGD
jgi:hypothetical protein|nr:MAG TPA: hypothetical protein [Caudoviricetes sp.]